jgi:glutathione peroxidase
MRRAGYVVAGLCVMIACAEQTPVTDGDAGKPIGKDAGQPPITDANAGDGSFACDPMAAAGSFFELSSPDLGQTRVVSMCEFRGDVILVVNTASYCGYTPEYAPLEAVYEKYAPQRFTILGFPCNQFGGQEPGEDSDISTFCTEKYGITFPMFTKSNVNPPDENPIYTWLKSHAAASIDAGGDITWNFNKFLLSRTGDVVARYDSPVEPDSVEVTTAIEAELAKPIPQFRGRAKRARR